MVTELMALSTPTPVEGRQVTLVDKETNSVGIHFGYHLPINRSDPDYYPLMVANSYLGEHRTFHGRLMQQLRGKRGLNYGDYSYIEAFPNGGGRSFPPQNVGRNQQIFEVWIRTLPNAQAHFALRAALRELELLVDKGLSEEQFELTRSFLEKYSLHFGL